MILIKDGFLKSSQINHNWSEKRHLSDPVKEISRHPEVVPHLDPLTRANLHHDGDGDKLYLNGSNWIGSIWVDPIGLIGWELTWNSHWAGITSAFVPPEIVQWQFDLIFFNDDSMIFFNDNSMNVTLIQILKMSITTYWPTYFISCPFPSRWWWPIYIICGAIWYRYVWFKIDAGRRRWWPMLTPA